MTKALETEPWSALLTVKVTAAALDRPWGADSVPAKALAKEAVLVSARAVETAAALDRPWAADSAPATGLAKEAVSCRGIAEH